MRSHLLACLAFAAPAAALASSCQQGASRIALTMRAPQGLLDAATQVQLEVVEEGAASCAGAALSGAPPEDSVQSFNLDKGGCASGAAWCKEITLERDDTTRVFHVVARSPAGILAEGCTRATVDQDPLEVDIHIERYNPPKCCNDGIIEAGEQCDLGPAAAAPTDCFGNPGGPQCLGIIPDPVCECDCLAKEILLSSDNTVAPLLTNGPPGSKTELALAFGGPTGSALPGALRALYTDSFNASGPSDIDMRALDTQLYPIPTGAFRGQLRLPQCSNPLLMSGKLRTQKTPAIASIATDTTAAVYASDETFVGRLQIYLSPQTEAGCADVDPILVNTNTTQSAEDPDVAGGPAAAALIVWRSGVQLRARIWHTDGTFQPTADELFIGTIAAGARPRVAGYAGGWLVAYSGTGTGDTDGIFLARVTTTGQVTSTTLVNAMTAGIQDQPDVAVLDDGRSAVVWRNSDARIFFQRFDAGGTPRTNDQLEPLQQSSPPPAADPVVERAGAYFAAAWAAGGGTIWGRFLGADSGFAFNYVTGQTGDFEASHPGIVGERSRPSLAVGNFVAVGWQDVSAGHPGVFVRRLPLPED